MPDILIVNSPGPLTDLLKDRLSSRHRVRICHTGKAAIAAIRQFPPDLLVLQLSLPDTDGLTLLKKLGKPPESIIALTNLLCRSVVDTATALGIRELILLPCSIAYLLDCIDACCPANEP